MAVPVPLSRYTFSIVTETFDGDTSTIQQVPLVRYILVLVPTRTSYQKMTAVENSSHPIITTVGYTHMGHLEAITNNTQ